jgi:hypothetical protein
MGGRVRRLDFGLPAIFLAGVSEVGVSNYDAIVTFLIVVAAICIAYNFGYSAAIKQFSERVNALADLVHQQRGGGPEWVACGECGLLNGHSRICPEYREGT